MAFTRKATPKKRRRKKRKSAPVAKRAAPRKRRKTRSDKGKRRGARRKPRSDRGRKRGKRGAKQRALAALAAKAWSGESRHSDTITQADINAAMKAWSGEGRHGGRRVSARRSPNPIHFPRTMRGRPSKTSYWLLDVYSGSYVTTYIGRSDKTTAQRDAMRKLIKSGADRVALSGPYRTKPHLQSVRK